MRHEKVYPDTELKIGDLVFYQGKWQEIYAFSESGTLLSHSHWTCKTKFQVEREVAKEVKTLEDKYCINGKMYFSAPYVDKLQAELKDKLEEKIKVLEQEKEEGFYAKELVELRSRNNGLSTCVQAMKGTIDRLRKANSELASAAISKDEVLCEFVPMNASICPNYSGWYTVNMDNGSFYSDELALVEFNSKDYVHKPDAKIKVVREVSK